MRLVLKSCAELELQPALPPMAVAPGEVALRVLCCAICRTDARMWREGHRDLVLPRVLGHEIAAVEPLTGRVYTVWPGEVCGNCPACRAERENFCDKMRIIGFHRDGGLAADVVVPRQSLIAVENGLDPTLVTFAEPVACLLNPLPSLAPQAEERALVVGGGVLGMLAALVLREQGCRVTVLEWSVEKIARQLPLARAIGVELLQETGRADFDLAITCCASPVAFAGAVGKLRKGGRLAFFSGLEKNSQIDSNLLNFIHYRELVVSGSYGPRRADMAAALTFCRRNQQHLGRLIDRLITPAEVAGVLPRVLAGQALKYIVDFRRTAPAAGPPAPRPVAVDAAQEVINPFLAEIVGAITPPKAGLREKAQSKVDQKTKPLGALGRIEALAVQLAMVSGSMEPRVDCRRMLVFAGDHGVVEEGVSAFPAKVTMQMVENFLAGGAAINVFCRHYGIELAVVDIGVNGDFADHPMLRRMKVARGTANFALGRAMSLAQALMAIENGARAFLDTQINGRCQLVGMGEMGIGNTTSATAIIAAATGRPVVELVGRGTGVDDQGLRRKLEVIDKALALHRPRPDDALELLSCLGGYELGGICGAVLAAAASGCAVVLDGIISTAAGLLAWLLNPAVADYLIAGHRSVEPGQGAALELIGLQPIVDLDLRLGEGTGAAITMNLADLACAMLREMASFAEAGVDSG